MIMIITNVGQISTFEHKADKFLTFQTIDTDLVMISGLKKKFKPT
jgi:hypothetical protein